MKKAGIDDTILEQIISKDARYKEQAYLFVLSALHHVLDSLKEPRHITGRELSAGCRNLALTQFGPLAKIVLEEWGIYKTEDIGEIVFNLLEHNVLAKTDKDSRADFVGLFDFSEVFEKNYPWGKIAK